MAFGEGMAGRGMEASVVGSQCTLSIFRVHYTIIHELSQQKVKCF